MSNSDAWTILIRLVTWTPQVLWAVCAAGLLRLGMRSLPPPQSRKRAWILPIIKILAAYGMVLYMMGQQMQLFGIPPFPPVGGYLGPSYTEFWETAVPSVWAVPGLVIIHIFCWLENLTLQRAQAAQAKPPG